MATLASAGSNTGSGASLVITGVTAAAGTDIMVKALAVNTGNNPISIASVTDSAGNTWTGPWAAQGGFFTGQNQYAAMATFTCRVTSTITAGTITITPSVSATLFLSGNYLVLSGCPAGSQAYAAQPTALILASQTSTASPALYATPGSVALAGLNFNGAISSASSSYAIPAGIAGAAALCVWLNVTAAGLTSTTITATASDPTWNTDLVLYGTPPPPPVPPRRPPGWMPGRMRRPRAAAPPAPPPPATLVNNMETGSNGVTIAPGNSGGGIDTAFDVVTTVAGGTTAFDSTRAAHGTLSAQIATGVTSGTSFVSWTTAMGNRTTVFYRLYLFITANPANVLRLFSALQGVTAVGSLALTTTGLLRQLNAAGATIQTGTVAVPVNQWVRIEGFITGDATAGQIEHRLFKSMDALAADEVLTSTAAQAMTGPPNVYRYGLATSVASAGPYWLDDLGLSSVTYLGPAGATQVPQPAPRRSYRPPRLVRGSAATAPVPQAAALPPQPPPQARPPRARQRPQPRHAAAGPPAPQSPPPVLPQPPRRRARPPRADRGSATPVVPPPPAAPPPVPPPPVMRARGRQPLPRRRQAAAPVPRQPQAQAQPRRALRLVLPRRRQPASPPLFVPPPPPPAYVSQRGRVRRVLGQLLRRRPATAPPQPAAPLPVLPPGAHIWAGPPHGRWAAGAPHGRYAADEPHGRWESRPPHA